MCFAHWLGEDSKQLIFGVSSHDVPCQKIDLFVLSCSLTVSFHIQDRAERVEPFSGMQKIWRRFVSN